MKTFKDLKFKAHSIVNGLHAVINFENNYGVSVVKFKGSYGYNADLWELAVLFNNEITYNSGITDDVIGYLTDERVTEIMLKVQKLK